MVKAKPRPPIEIAGVSVAPGTRQSIDIPLPSFYTHSSVNMPVHVVHGRKPGPVLLVCAAIHGDEINGTEIIRRLLAHRAMNRLRGTLIAIPVVNVYGFVSKSRYLPDRRDLNRSFPGSETGSMASRLAHVVMEQIITHCTHIVDLHTGAVYRENLPQIRAKLRNDPEIERLARAFGVPVILDADLLEGSFRAACHDQDVPVILYEAGEALRFDELAIRAGVRGVLNVMTALGMRVLTRTPKAPTWGSSGTRVCPGPAIVPLSPLSTDADSSKISTENVTSIGATFVSTSSVVKPGSNASGNSQTSLCRVPGHIDRSVPMSCTMTGMTEPSRCSTKTDSASRPGRTTSRSNVRVLRAGIETAWKESSASVPSSLTADTSTRASSAKGLNSRSVRRSPSRVEPPATCQMAGTFEEHRSPASIWSPMATTPAAAGPSENSTIAELAPTTRSLSTATAAPNGTSPVSPVSTSPLCG